MSAIKRLLQDESGQGLAEYGLILAGVAVICIAAIFALGGVIGNKLNEIDLEQPSN